MLDRALNGRHRNLGQNSPTATLVFSPMLFCVILAIYVLLPTGHPLRLAMYTNPFLVALELLFLQNLNISKRWFYVLFAFLAYSGLMAVGSPDLMRAAKEVIFISLPVLLLTLNFKVHHSFFAAFLISISASSFVLALNSDAALFAVSLEYSSAAAETSVGLAIPLVAFAYLHRRNLMGGGLSIFAMLLSYKRIAFGAFSLLSLLFYVTGVLKLKGVRQIAGLIILSILVLAGLNMAPIYAAVSKLLLQSGIEIAPNALSSGRHAMELSYRAAVLEHFNVWQLFFGAGPGASGHFFALYSQYSGTPFPHLHNDWLRIYAEYGLVGLAMVVFVMGKLVLKGHFAWFAALYTGFCFLTDNVLTYSFYWFILVFCSRVQYQMSAKVVRT